MPSFAGVLDALYDLLDAQEAFSDHVSKHDFGKLSESGDVTIVLRVGGFTNTDDAFGGAYNVTWSIFADIYNRYSQNAEEDTEILVAARDALVDLIQQNIYLGKGQGNSEQIQAASIVRGNALEFVLDETDIVTHFCLTVEIQVYQILTVTLE